MNLLYSIQNGIEQGIIFFPVVLSLALSYRLLKFPDISIEGTFVLGSSVFATVLLKTNSIIYAVLFASIYSFIAGGVTAVLHYYLKINKFLAGIIIVTALYSIAIRIAGSSNISILQINMFNENSTKIFFIASILISILILVFYKSHFGILIRGSALNPDLSSAIGHKTGLLLIIGLALNNVFAAVSGIFFTLENGFSDIKMGQGILIIGLAAIAIGERIIPKKALSVPLFVILSAAIGSIFYQILWAFALKLNVKPSDLKILSAIIVVLLFLLKRRKNADDEL